MPYFSTSLLHLPFLFPNSWAYISHFNNLEFWLYVKFSILCISVFLDSFWERSFSDSLLPARGPILPGGPVAPRSRERQAAVKPPPPRSARTCILLNITEEGAGGRAEFQTDISLSHAIVPFPKDPSKIKEQLIKYWQVRVSFLNYIFYSVHTISHLLLWGVIKIAFFPLFSISISFMFSF